MAKQQPATVTKSHVDGPNRSRRSAFTRQSLTREMKRMFADAPKSIRKQLLKAEQAKPFTGRVSNPEEAAA